MVFKIILGLFLLAACDGVPPREKFPGAQGRTTDVEQVETQKAVLGGFDPMRSRLPSDGAQQQAAANQGPVDPKKTIKGVVKLGPKIVVSESMYFFLAARPKDGGPPLAARRMQRPDFPYEFTLSQADSMTGAPFEGEVEITARLDKDGDPLTHEAGDYFGALKTKVGDQKAVIVIDQDAQ